MIRWTKEHGGTSDDPSVLAFVVGADGKVVEKAPDAQAHQPRAFAQWLVDHADRWERSHPKTKVPFIGARVVGSGAGASRKASCPEFDAARKEGKPVACYVGRAAREGDGEKEKTESGAARRFEKEVLGSERAAKAADGWLLLRVDRGDPDAAAFVADLGVTAAPSIVIVLASEGKPVVLDRMTSATTLVKWFEKGKEGSPTDR